ncbi:MAG TPA: hypothetical protein VFZ09_15730 [Archangium sp.]|uniref:hypothetical protein n=1 Tax=Archangium sp. TaxID=1872627 RepID=UPI002E322685|nr:hypothetical protein [Archangium sp.]HEX5747697.1 hypothetical protein [Archangium sp.]
MGIREVPDGRWQLLFPPRLLNPALEVLSLDDVRPLLDALAPLAPPRTRTPRLRLLESPGADRASPGHDSDWEARLREELLSRFGPPLLPLPESLSSSRLFLALQLSTRYVAEGIREAAVALFASPAFVISVCFSIVVYFSAWLAPEPLFSKAFAATLTLRLSLAVGLLELGQVAMACLRLYQEVETASTPEALEAASARFGRSMGGTYLRVLVTVGSLGLARLIPQVPEGGIWRLLPPVTSEGLVILQQSASTAQVVADGTLIVSGVAAGTATCSGLALCSTSASSNTPNNAPKLSTRYGKPHTRKNPPHNEAIEDELAAREAAGHTDLRKNKAQVSAQKKLVEDPNPVRGTHFRKPDVSSIRPDGVRHNINYVSNARDMRRELEAFDSMVRADARAIHELYLLDGTLVRRHVPSGVLYP